MILEPAISGQIALVFGVLSAINFNDQTPFAADEINDVGADRLLPDEFHAAK